MALDVKTWFINQYEGTQVVYKNAVTGQNLYLVCPPGEDLQQFIDNNMAVAEAEVGSM